MFSDVRHLLLASLRSRDADVDDAVKNGCCAHLWTCHAIFTASSTSASRNLKLAIDNYAHRIIIEYANGAV